MSILHQDSRSNQFSTSNLERNTSVINHHDKHRVPKHFFMNEGINHTESSSPMFIKSKQDSPASHFINRNLHGGKPQMMPLNFRMRMARSKLSKMSQLMNITKKKKVKSASDVSSSQNHEIKTFKCHRNKQVIKRYLPEYAKPAWIRQQFVAQNEPGVQSPKSPKKFKITKHSNRIREEGRLLKEHEKKKVVNDWIKRSCLIIP